MTDVTSIETRFILHLVFDLKKQVGLAKIPLTRAFLPLAVIFSSAEFDMSAVKIALSDIIREWENIQHHAGKRYDEFRDMITQALEYLSAAVNIVLAGKSDTDDTNSTDDFISAVFNCRDRIMALDLMARMSHPSSAR